MTEKQRYKLKNIILYILSNFSGGADYIKLYKILYFANREHLAKVGVPLINDNFKAWDYGPVPSFTGMLVKKLESKEDLSGDMDLFKGSMKVRKNKLVVAIEKPRIDEIPMYTRGFLDGYIRKYKYYSSKRLSEESHDEAWKEAYVDRGGHLNGKAVINPVLMAGCADADDDMLVLLRHLYGNDPEYVHLKENPAVADALEIAAGEIYELGGLPMNWDGEEADAIDSRSAMNCRKLLLYKNARVNYIDAIYPTPGGSICIDWRKNGAKLSAEINGDRMAYYYVSADRKECYDSPAFSFENSAQNPIFEDLNRLK